MFLNLYFEACLAWACLLPKVAKQIRLLKIGEPDPGANSGRDDSPNSEPRSRVSTKLMRAGGPQAEAGYANDDAAIRFIPRPIENWSWVYPRCYLLIAFGALIGNHDA
ncbi:MAG: hypothetical protein INR62_14090 [Rhodospirillales bacterium]|nr:hypothetical protein [Acetobacter sp.]